ncbi:MAG TPA: hypothetical protein VHL99_09485 [Candidatus Binatia bacterium]|nr:hypothetical protein [Candidatus Binatia bacterium]
MKLQAIFTTSLLLAAVAAGAQTTQPTTPNTTGTTTLTTPNKQNAPSTSNTTSNTNKSNAQSPAAGGQRTDFALFDGTDPTSGEVGAQCGATLGSSKNSVGFTYYVTVSNWSDELKVLQVLYADGEEMARYQIPAHTSFSFSQAAGGTAGVDDWIRVFAEGTAPSGLAGSMSIFAPAAAKPNSNVGQDFCTTLVSAPTTAAPTTR